MDPQKSSRFKLAVHEAHLLASRHVALLALNTNCCLVSQHLRGDLNTVADLLSFAGDITRAGEKKHPVAFDDPPDDIPTQRFHLCCPGQIPANFKISSPSVISSWVMCILQTAASCLTVEPKKATNPRTGHGDAGLASAPKPDEAMTLSSISHPQTDKNFLSDPSSPAFERPDGRKEAELLQESAKSQWSRALCAKPQATWSRHSGTITNKVPSTSKALPSCFLPPAPSSKPSPMPTLCPNGSTPSAQNCCEARAP